MQVGLEVMEVDFIVVDAYSPYTTIVAKPWLHAMRAVSSTIHLKVKYSSEDQVEELVGSRSMARQCLVAAIRHQATREPSAPCWAGFIAIKGASVVYGCGVRRGRVQVIGKSCYW